MAACISRQYVNEIELDLKIPKLRAMHNCLLVVFVKILHINCHFRLSMVLNFDNAMQLKITRPYLLGHAVPLVFATKEAAC